MAKQFETKSHIVYTNTNKHHSTPYSHKNSGRGTKPAYIFMVIIPYWWSSSRLLPMVIQVMIFIRGRNLALSMLCNIIPPVGLLLVTSKSTVYSLTEKFNQPGYVGVRPRSNSYLTI